MRREYTKISVIFLLPAIVVYTIFMIYPIISSLYYSLTEWDGARKPIFVGIRNFIEIFHDEEYWKAYLNTIDLIFYSVIFQISLGLIIAYILYRGVKGFKIFRAVYFLPVVISPIAIGLMFTLFYNSEMGILNKILDFVGLHSLKREWLSDPNVVLASVMIPQIWQYIGLYVVIFLAALQGIPDEIIESAYIDGASSLVIFFRIIIPLLWEIIQIAIILCVTGSLKSFDYSWVMTQGGPGVLSSYLGVLMFRRAFVESNLGQASAIAVTILANSLLFTVIFKKYTSTESVQY